MCSNGFNMNKIAKITHPTGSKILGTKVTKRLVDPLGIFPEKQEGETDEQRARRLEDERQARIKTGMGQINDQFNRFDDAFYKGRSDAYMNFAMPQLDQQYEDAHRGLTFALARQGIGESAEGNRRFGNQRQEYDLNRQMVVDRSIQAGADARRSVEDARAGLIQDLHNTSDPAAANAAALQRATYLQSNPAMQQLGTLFGNGLNGLNTYQNAKDDATNYNAALSMFNLPSSNGSGKNYGGG